MSDVLVLRHVRAVDPSRGLRGWPRVAEDAIVARDVALAEFTRSKYHAAHVSTLGSAAILREAKSRGIAVTAPRASGAGGAPSPQREVTGRVLMTIAARRVVFEHGASS